MYALGYFSAKFSRAGVAAATVQYRHSASKHQSCYVWDAFKWTSTERITSTPPSPFEVIPSLYLTNYCRAASN